MSADATFLATATLASVVPRALTSIPFRRRTGVVGGAVGGGPTASGRRVRTGRTAGGGG
ncbi:hypothetical protein [Halorussus sp. AFM4]|uniref:hypothetical protein n=1 Tax=Halorussus sp. AFM4 TaxID=3421651 RepID=UPI003EBCC047